MYLEGECVHTGDVTKMDALPPILLHFARNDKRSIIFGAKCSRLGFASSWVTPSYVCTLRYNGCMERKVGNTIESYFESDFQLVGNYDLPLVQRQDFDLTELKLLRFSGTVKNETRDFDERSFAFCFDGIENGSVVAVSTLGCRDVKEAFMAGFAKMCEIIEPEVVICYNKPFDEMRELSQVIEVPYARNSRLAIAI